MGESTFRQWVGRIKGAWAVLSGSAFATYYVTVEQQNIWVSETSDEETK